MQGAHSFLYSYLIPIFQAFPIFSYILYQGANHPIFVKTDMVYYKRLLYMVGFLRPPATTSGRTTFPTG